MAADHQGFELRPIITLLAAAVIGAPLFKRLGLGSVLGYLAGGLAIGPFGLKVFTHPQAILHVAELGVVMFLFVIGLEMQPSRLWGLRRQIFGLGLTQVLVCVDKPEDGTRITQLLKSEFPHVPVLARANDRRHSIELIRAGADVEVRETFESAVVLGAAALEKLGASADEIAQISARIRDRDEQRLQLELIAGMDAGRAFFTGKPGQANAPPSEIAPD